MKHSRFHQTISGLALLAAILACALPGKSGQPDNTEPNVIQTAIEGTAQAAAQETAVAKLFTATPEGPSGTTIEQLADATTKYTDYDAGFEIIYPAGWLTVRPNSAEFDAAVNGIGAVNEMLKSQLDFDKSDYQERDRLYSYILRPDIKTNVMFGFSKLQWDDTDSKMLDNMNMGDLVRGLETEDGLPGFRAEIAQIHDEANTRVMEIGGRWTLNDGSEPIHFYSVFYFFKPTQDSTVRVAITFMDDYRSQLEADARSIMDSIHIIEP